MDRIRMGVVGCGGLFRTRMLPAILARKDVRLTVLADSDPRALAEARAAGAMEATCFASVEEAVRGGEFEVAYVASPNHLHVPQAAALLAAGRHVLVEKPLASSVAEGLRLAALAAKSQAVCMVAYMAKFNAYNIAALEAVRSGELGPLRRIDAYFSYRLTNPAAWRLQPQCGGGVLADIGIYCLTTIRDLLEAAGRGQRLARVEATCLPVPSERCVESAVTARLLWADGVEANCSTSFWAPLRAGYEVWCERGTVIALNTWYQDGQGVATVGRLDGTGSRLQPREVEPYAAELDHFLELARTGRQPDARFSIGGALEDLKFLDAIQQAARSGGAAEVGG